MPSREYNSGGFYHDTENKVTYFSPKHRLRSAGLMILFGATTTIIGGLTFEMVADSIGFEGMFENLDLKVDGVARGGDSAIAATSFGTVVTLVSGFLTFAFGQNAIMGREKY